VVKRIAALLVSTDSRSSPAAENMFTGKLRGEVRDASPSSEGGPEQVVICIDRVSEQISTDSGKKDGQNLTDVGSAAVLSGGICF